MTPKGSLQQEQRKTASSEDERVSRVREHFLALAGPSTEGSYNRPQQPAAADQDELRVARLLAHYKSVTSSGNGYSSENGGTPSCSRYGDEGAHPKRTVVLKTTTFEAAPVAKEEGDLSSDANDDSSDSDNTSSDDSDSEFETVDTTAATAAVSADATQSGNDEADSHSSSSYDSDSNEASNNTEDSCRVAAAGIEEDEDSSDSSSSSDDDTDDSEEQGVQKGDSKLIVSRYSGKKFPMEEHLGDCTDNQHLPKKIKVAHKKQAAASRVAGVNGSQTVKVSNKAVKRQGGDEMEVEAFNYDNANFKMFATNRSRGRGRKNKGRVSICLC